ncbi:MAG: hypothetical protein U9R60_08265 [Bacteroidota bacterium]|nr:hypothetical protein [Bacteroidota bacterium]
MGSIIFDESGEVYGKFNPIYFNPVYWTCEMNTMEYNSKANKLYAITPDLKILYIEPDLGPYATFSFSTHVVGNYDPPASTIPEHYKPLHSNTIIKYDKTHDRLYWVVFARDPNNHTGNFHMKESSFSIYNIDNTSGEVLSRIWHIVQTSSTYEDANISDIEFNSSADYFYLSKLNKLEIWHYVSGQPVVLKEYEINAANYYTNNGPGGGDAYYKFGKMIYINSDELGGIHKIIALPYRYKFMDLKQGAVPDIFMINGDHGPNPNTLHLETLPAPSEKILDAVFLEGSSNDLVISFAPDPQELVQPYANEGDDIAIYEYLNNQFTHSQSINTNYPSTTTDFDINSSLKLLKFNDNHLLISKKDEIVQLYYHNNAYHFNQILQRENNFFMGGASNTSNKGFIINLTASNIEYLNYNNGVFSHDKSITKGSPVYHITGNIAGDKLYVFNKLDTYEQGLYICDCSGGDELITNINKDLDGSGLYTQNDINYPVGDCIFNPFKDHFLVSLNAEFPNNNGIRVIRADDDSFVCDIELTGAAYAKEMFIDPQGRLYVFANMHYDRTPKLYVYNACDEEEATYSHIITFDLTGMTNPVNKFEFYSGHFSYNYNNHKLYATIHPTEVNLDPYNSVPNSHFEYPETNDPPENTGLFITIDDNAISLNSLEYPGKLICPFIDNPDISSKYNEKVFVIGKKLNVFNIYTETFDPIDGIDEPFNDIIYSPLHDQLFGLRDTYDEINTAGDRKIQIFTINHENSAFEITEITSNDGYDGQATSLLNNPYDGKIYIHKKFDDEKLGGTPMQLLITEYDPDLQILDIIEEVDLERTCIYPELDFCEDYDYHLYNITTPYINPYNNTIYIPNGGQSCMSKVAFDPDEALLLQKGQWTWLSFPRLDRTSGDPSVHNVLYGPSADRINPINYRNGSKLQNIEIGETELDENEYLNYMWQSSGTELTHVNSIFGYKLYLDYTTPPDKKWLFLLGDLIDPEDGKVDLYGDNHENWLGYYLPVTQSPFDAIADDIEPDIGIIKAQYWTCYNDEPIGDNVDWRCAINKGGVKLKYGDMVIIKTNNMVSIPDFKWTIYGNPVGGTEEKMATEYYSFEETSSYIPLFIELDSTENPVEIGAFIEDTCYGATTVLPDDTLVLINAYTDSVSGEIYFEEYYGSNKSLRPSIQEYWVRNNMTKSREKRIIHTNENQDYYVVSFTNKEKYKKELEESSPWITCIPNPVIGNSSIRCYIPESCNAKLLVYDLYGRKVKIIQEGLLGSGMYNFIFDGTDSNGKQLENGVYFVCLVAGKFHAFTKLMIIK